MADIYLEHPIHGQKVCHSESEAAYDRGHGWVEFDPKERVKPAPVEESPAPEPEPEMPAFLAPAPVAPPPPVKIPKPKKAEG